MLPSQSIGTKRRHGRPFIYAVQLPTQPDSALTNNLDFPLTLHGAGIEDSAALIRLIDVQNGAQEWGDKLAPARAFAGALRAESDEILGYHWYGRPYELQAKAQIEVQTDGVDSDQRFFCWFGERTGETKTIDVRTPTQPYVITNTREYVGAELVTDLEIGNYSKPLFIYGAVSDMPPNFKVRINDQETYRSAWSKTPVPVAALAQISGEICTPWVYPVGYYLPARSKLTLDVQASAITGTFSFSFLCEVA
jgi:hypothetical protein